MCLSARSFDEPSPAHASRAPNPAAFGAGGWQLAAAAGLEPVLEQPQRSMQSVGGRATHPPARGSRPPPQGPARPGSAAAPAAPAPPPRSQRPQRAWPPWAARPAQRSRSRPAAAHSAQPRALAGHPEPSDLGCLARLPKPYGRGAEAARRAARPPAGPHCTHLAGLADLAGQQVGRAVGNPGLHCIQQLLLLAPCSRPPARPPLAPAARPPAAGAPARLRLPLRLRLYLGLGCRLGRRGLGQGRSGLEQGGGLHP